jgi:AcrR family transcriptional regulator
LGSERREGLSARIGLRPLFFGPCTRISRTAAYTCTLYTILVYNVYMKEPTAQRIVASAAALLDRDGAESVTMRRVAKAVGVTAMALYRHFADRAALLHALADAGFEDLAARVMAAPKPRDPEKRLLKILDEFLNFALERPRLFELMFLTRRAGARTYPRDFKAGQSATANLTTEAITEGIKTGCFRKEDAWEITFAMGALLQGLVMLYLGGRMEMDTREFRAFCQRSFRRYVHGIRS